MGVLEPSELGPADLKFNTGDRLVVVVLQAPYLGKDLLFVGGPGSFQFGALVIDAKHQVTAADVQAGEFAVGIVTVKGKFIWFRFIVS